MFRHSWSQALFVGEPIEASFERLGRLGYEGVELPALSMPPNEVRARLAQHGLKCFSVNGSFNSKRRDLSSSDVSLRAAAVDYVAMCMRFAAAVAAEVVIVVPTRIGKLQPDITLAEEWDNAVRSLQQIGEIGRSLGVTAVIECVNRSETYLANRLETARRLIEAVGSCHVMAMGDSFHMNIEEEDICKAIEEVAPYLRHFHLADNNRAAPGMGHMDIESILRTLGCIGYTGPLTMECDVQAPDQYGRNAFTTSAAVFDAYAATAIGTLRGIEARLIERAADADRLYDP